MLVPILIVVACLAVGTLAAARWLPELAPGQVGGLAFFVVTGLLAAALALVGLHTYTLINQLDRSEDVDES